MLEIKWFKFFVQIFANISIWGMLLSGEANRAIRPIWQMFFTLTSNCKMWNETLFHWNVINFILFWFWLCTSLAIFIEKWHTQMYKRIASTKMLSFCFFLYKRIFLYHNKIVFGPLKNKTKYIKPHP